MLFPKKRAIMGISTLIIFIATILVAAVAAAVLISTSNVLQQRSLLVGQDARKSITNAIELISIITTTDQMNETFNNFEILLRLAPGSDALQMRVFDIQYISPIFDQTAILYYADNRTNLELGEVNTSWAPVYDMDGDGDVDYVRVINGTDSSIDLLQFNLTSEGISRNISLGVDLSNSGSVTKTIRTDEEPVKIGEDIYGFVKVNGISDENYAINENASFVVNETPNSCSFDLLQPETRYCFQVLNGNLDTALNVGERFRILYKVKREHELTTGQDFSFIFTNEKGRMTEVTARTPDVIVSTKTKLWPIG